MDYCDRNNIIIISTPPHTTPPDIKPHVLISTIGFHPLGSPVSRDNGKTGDWCQPGLIISSNLIYDPVLPAFLLLLLHLLHGTNQSETNFLRI